MAGGPVFGRQDGLPDGALARPRQGRLDEFRRRPLAHGAWPRAPRTQRQAPGTHGAGRRGRGGGARERRPGRRTSQPRATAAGAIPALPSAAQWGWQPWRKAHARPPGCCASARRAMPSPGAGGATRAPGARDRSPCRARLHQRKLRALAAATRIKRSAQGRRFASVLSGSPSANTTVSAAFDAIPATLTAAASPGGSVAAEINGAAMATVAANPRKASPSASCPRRR